MKKHRVPLALVLRDKPWDTRTVQPKTERGVKIRMYRDEWWPVYSVAFKGNGDREVEASLEEFYTVMIYENMMCEANGYLESLYRRTNKGQP